MRSLFPVSIFPALLALLVWLLPIAAVRAADPGAYNQPVLHPAIPLLDEAGRHVLLSGQPYSPKMSCGNGNGSGCHDYGKIAKGYHFQQGRDEAGDDFGQKRGLPQLVSPGYFGGYTCMGMNNAPWAAKKANASAAEFADLGAADAMKECGQCHAGGGWGETDRNGVRYDQKPATEITALDGDYFAWDGAAMPTRWDWQRSGVREVDCLHCHADFSNLTKPAASNLGATNGSDGSATALAHYRKLKEEKLIPSGEFRYAASAVLEFLNLRPDLPEGLSLLSFGREVLPGSVKPEYRLARGADGKPVLNWNVGGFGGDLKAHIPMTRFPGSDNCMTCHETGNARRGFYGFGEDARQTRDAFGVAVTDFRDDVHKGVTWTEDNGEARVIDNCNACHAQEYYKPAYSNVNLDAEHQFPKGRGDNDVRNDLDDLPKVKSCEHCHDTAAKPALPSGQKNALQAHLVLWQSRGDMAGYTADTLTRITQSHLDAVACQTCHINHLAKPDGTPLDIHFRYRRGEDGKPKIFPYYPAYRYYAADKTSGRVLNRWETNDALGGGSAEPQDYQGYKALQQALNQMLATKGYTRPEVRFVLTESNDYVISHNTRPSPQAAQCADCHARQQDGSFSALLSADGLLASDRLYQVAKLPDRRLVDEGVFELGMPQYRVDGAGRVTARLADILYASRLEPSMTILKAETARAVAGGFKQVAADTGAGYLGLSGDAATQAMASLNSGEWLLFNTQTGHESVRGYGLILNSGLFNKSLLQDARVEVESREVQPAERKRIKKLLVGAPGTDTYALTVQDAARNPVKAFEGGPALVKLPYPGKATSTRKLRLVYSDGGQRWRKLPRKDLVAFQPATDSAAGYVVARIAKPYARIALTGPARKAR